MKEELKNRMVQWEKIDAYDLVKEEALTDLNSVGYMLKHKKTGAKVAVISNDDVNKVFSIGFRTPPEDSTGVAHIVEHTVLCGSREFPAKDPFVELVKGSLNTFLNAMTYPDKTVYPIASCNDKDFQNLMHVYMDAVFYPNIYKKEEIFKQEGWHYELNDVEDAITYNGVVYNEMKGAFSSPEQQLYRLIQSSLFPDTAYGVESGGDPKDIPTLTYENYLEFHKKYYHPSNSYIYLYGDMDVEEKLRWMDEKYLSHFSYAPVDSEIKFQKPFAKTKEVVEAYPLTEGEDSKDKTYISYNTVVDTSLNKELYVAFQILEYVLIDNPGAPLKQALLDKGIGKDILSSYDNGILQPVFSIIVKDANEEQKDAFMDILTSTLQKLVKEGLDEQALLAAITYFEFKYREADFGSYPKGLMYGLQMFDSWLYSDTEIFTHILANDTFAFLKQQIKSGYFEKLIEKYLLHNAHSTIVIVKPEEGLTAKKDALVAEELAKYKASLSQEQLEQLVKDTKALKAYQEEPSTQEELESIPMLTREDMKKEVRPLISQEREAEGQKIIFQDVYTNGIAYIKFVFDISELTKLAPYLSLLTTALGYMNTEAHTYLEFSNETNIYTGGLLADTNTYSQVGKKDAYKFTFELRTKVLYENIKKAMSLLKEMVFTTDFSDDKRLLEIIVEAKSRLQMKLNGSGHSAALTRSMSYFSELAKLNDEMEGIAYYNFLCDLEKNFAKKSKQVKEIFKQILLYAVNKENMLMSVTADEDGYKAFVEAMPEFLSAVEEKRTQSKPEADISMLAHGKQEGFKYAGQVQYVARSGNFFDAGLSYHGALQVLKVIMGYDYLWNNVRVKGGAYGCMCGFAVTGNAYFVSYRDPGLKETNAIYEKAYEYVENFEVSDRDMTKYMIGAISNLDTPLTPSAIGTRSFNAYMNGMTEEYLQTTRNQVLEVTQEDIRALAPIIKVFVEQGNLCVIGNEKKIEENEELFDHITSLL